VRDRDPQGPAIDSRARDRDSSVPTIDSWARDRDPRGRIGEARARVGLVPSPAMAGGPDLDPRRVLEHDRERFILKRLLGYAYRRTSDVARAKDLAQEAVALVLEGRGWLRWTYDGVKSPERSLLDHLCNVARSTAKDERKAAAARREIPFDIRKHDVAHGLLGLEETYLDEAEHARRMRLAERVMARLDPLALRLLELEQADVHEAARQAEIAACTVTEVYLARQRIAYHRDAVLAEEGGPT